MPEEYIQRCWNCLSDFDAIASVWCNCDPRNPSKLCPFCLQCFCKAAEDYKAAFWQNAPFVLTVEQTSLRNIKDRIGELLFRSHMIRAEELLQALNEQSSSGDRIGQVLVKNRLLTEEELTLFLEMQSFSVPQEFTEKRVDLEQLRILNPEFCLQRKILPLKVFSGSIRSFLVLAMANLKDTETIDIVNRKTSMIAVPFYAEDSSIVSFLRDRIPNSQPQEPNQADMQSAIRKLITSAIKRHASDIHIEPGENEINVRYRIDGVLYVVKPIEKKDQDCFISEIKKLAKMDLVNKQFPQSNRLVLTWEDQKFQLNFHTFPTPYGENINIKIVNLAAFQRGLQDIGLDEYDYTKVLLALDSSFGLIAVSGPVMNGCSTTQYAMLRYLSASNRKVMTLESPIYAMIKNIHQTEIKPTAGYDYVGVLNSIIRSDPDVIFLSDLPNAEIVSTVCKIASRCVVVVTLPANSTGDTIVLLRELGASPSMLSHSLSLIVNQRLIRKICNRCIRKNPISPSILIQMGFREEEIQGLETSTGAGCSDCNYLGFQGRTAIFELLTANQRIGESIASGALRMEIEKSAFRMGTIPLRARCLQKVAQGVTTVEEFEKCKFDS